MNRHKHRLTRLYLHPVPLPAPLHYAPKLPALLPLPKLHHLHHRAERLHARKMLPLLKKFNYLLERFNFMPPPANKRFRVEFFVETSDPNGTPQFLQSRIERILNLAFANKQTPPFVTVEELSESTPVRHSAWEINLLQALYEYSQSPKDPHAR